MAAPSSTHMAGSMSRSVRHSLRRVPPASTCPCAPRLVKSYSKSTAVASAGARVAPTFPGSIPQRGNYDTFESLSPTAQARKQRRDVKEEERFNPRTISIKLETEEMDLVTAYAILREVERKFGKLREFGCLRDRYDPSKLYENIRATFESDNSIKRLEESGLFFFPVSVPPNRTPSLRNPAVDGGVGLEDISDLMRSAYVDANGREHVDMTNAGHSRQSSLDSSDAAPGAGTSTSKQDGNIEEVVSPLTRQEQAMSRDQPTPSSENNVVYVRITRGPFDWQFTLHRNDEINPTPRMFRRRIHHAFIQWAGFYPHDFSSNRENNTNDASGGEGGVIKEAKSSMQEALSVSRKRLRDLGDLEYATVVERTRPPDNAKDVEQMGLRDNAKNVEQTRPRDNVVDVEQMRLPDNAVDVPNALEGPSKRRTTTTKSNSSKERINRPTTSVDDTKRNVLPRKPNESSQSKANCPDKTDSSAIGLKESSQTKAKSPDKTESPPTASSPIPSREPEPTKVPEKKASDEPQSTSSSQADEPKDLKTKVWSWIRGSAQ